MAEALQQALQMATTNAQLAMLPTFCNDTREDKSSATEWLQKHMNNRRGAGWTDLQTITHFRNALRREVLKWYNALPLMDINNLDWQVVKARFEIDYRATPTVSSAIQKLPEI